MPITRGFTARTALEKGEGHIHSDKWHRCVEHVKAQNGKVNPYAVCTASIGKESINPKHRRKKVEEPAPLTYGLTSRTLIHKSNSCHNPAGSSTGGEFCSSSVEIPPHRPYLNAKMKPSEMMWAYVKEKWGNTFAQTDLVDAVINAAGKQGFVPGRPQRRNAQRGTLSDQKRGVLAWMDWMDKQK